MVFLQCLVEGRENRLARERAEAEKARLELENTRGLLDAVNLTTAELRTEAGALLGADDEVERLRRGKRTDRAGAHRASCPGRSPPQRR